MGAEVRSVEPKLDKLTGLVCIFSPVTWLGMMMDLATFSRGALISVGSGRPSFDRFREGELDPPKMLCTAAAAAAAAGFGLTCRGSS